MRFFQSHVPIIKLAIWRTNQIHIFSIIWFISAHVIKGAFLYINMSRTGFFLVFHFHYLIKFNILKGDPGAHLIETYYICFQRTHTQNQHCRTCFPRYLSLFLKDLWAWRARRLLVCDKIWLSLFGKKKAIKSQTAFHPPQENSEFKQPWDHEFTILRRDDGMLLYATHYNT